MSGNKGSKQAAALQAESLEESRRANNMQLEFLNRQTIALEKTRLPAFKPAAPPPTPGTGGGDYASSQARLQAKRRFGYEDTVMGGRRLNTATV